MSRPDITEPHYSASQVTLFRRCPTAWWIKYVAGVKPPTTEAQERGKMVHGHLERYLRDGTPIPFSKYGKIALSGLEHLPEPGSGEVESEMWLRGETPLPMLGFIDWMDLYGETPVILDHKTSSALRWTLEERTRDWEVWETAEGPQKTGLEDDVQMTTYGKHALEVTGASEVLFRHVYYGTRYENKYRSKYWSVSVQIVVPASRIEQNWSGIVETTCEMSRTSALKESEVPQVDTACSAYGGCTNLSRCYPVRKRVSNVDVDVDALFDGLASGNKAIARAASEIARAAASLAQPSETSLGILEGVNGPEAPPNVENLERAAPVAPETEVAKTKGRRVRHPETQELITREERDALFFKENEVWVRRDGVSAGAAPSAPVGQMQPSPGPHPGGSTNGTRKRIYIGCAPVKFYAGPLHCVQLSDVVHPYVTEVLAQHSVFDLGLIEMGKGYDLVTARLREDGWPEGVDGIIIDKFLKGAERWIAALIPMADEIVRSF